MRRKNKHIDDTTSCLEAMGSKDNSTIRNVKVLGIYSKNGRVYPLNVMRESAHLYEGVVVNLDHSASSVRSVHDRFGQINNVRVEEDGIYGDLTYNPEHAFAKTFEWFVDNQPDAIGLSHAAIARTKMDRDNIETCEAIVELESVDLVAQAATNKNLFESYQKIMESVMKDKKIVKEDAAVHHAPAPAQHHVETMGDDKNLPHVSWGEKVEAFKAKKYESKDEYDKDLCEALDAVMKADLPPAHKVEAINGLCKSYESHDKVPDGLKKEASDAEMALDEAEDKDDKVKAEESIRRSNHVGFKLLLEELDSYRLREAHTQTVAKIKAYCEKAGLNEKHVTEAFIDVLASVKEDKWAALVADRKNIASTSKLPVSFSSQMIHSQHELTVDKLVQALRS